MADIAITASSVVAADGAVSKQEYIAGATIAAGDIVYVDTANNNVVKLAQADGTALEATVKGMALNSAASGQPVLVAVSGDVTVNSVLTVAQVYILSATAGKICLDVTDLDSSEYLSIVGIGTTATNLKLNIFNSGVEKA